VAEVDAVLAADGLTRDAVMAQALALKIDEVERIDRMVAGAEARLNVALRDLQASRDSRGSAASGGRGYGCRIQGNPAQLTEGEAGGDERP
jgi:hypothetical protein